MKRFTVIATAVFLTCGFLSDLGTESRAESHKIVEMQSWSAPFGTGNYLQSNALEDLSKKNHPWLRIKAKETHGFVWNLQQIGKQPEEGEKVTFQSCMNMVWMAGEPIPPFKEKITGIKCLANWTVASMCLMTLNPNIKSVADLKGKKVALGLMSQNNYGFLPRMIIEEGWGMKGNLNIQMVGLSQATDALVDGLADAAINAYYPAAEPGGKAGPGTDLIRLMGSGKAIYHVDLGKEQIEKLAQTKGVPIWPIVATGDEGLQGLRKGIVGMGTDAGHWCTEKLPDELAYEFTKFYWENCGKIKDYFSGGIYSTQKMATTGVYKSHYHRAAIKFYEEVGAVWR